jgi:glutathione S-transferase
MPDQKIFPHATGEAAKTVEKHQEPQELIFYSGWFCPFVQVLSTNSPQKIRVAESK